MVKKTQNKIWLPRRMKKLSVDEMTISTYWKSEGLCQLEIASPVQGSRKYVAAVAMLPDKLFFIGQRVKKTCRMHCPMITIY